MAPNVSSAWLPPCTDQELPVRVSKSCWSGRAPAELGDGLAVAEVVHGVDDVALREEPLLDAVEAGQAAGVVVDLAVETVEVVVVGAGREDELAADHDRSSRCRGVSMRLATWTSGPS
jgi:hypothetical protein